MCVYIYIGVQSHGPRGIASGAKIRFARCRFHPRASPPTYLRSAGSIRATPTYHPIVRPSGPVTGPPSSPPSRPVPRKLERAPPFDPADSHPPQPSAADLTPSPTVPKPTN